MKKVLHYVSIMNRGGQETFIMNVFNAINRENILFDFLCTLNQQGDYDEEINKLNGTIFHLDLGKFKIPMIDRFFSLWRFLNVHKKEYETFHIHTQHAMDGFLNALVAKKAKIPKVIVHSHNTNTMYHPLAHKLFKPLLKNMNVNKFACSDLAGQWLFGKETLYKVICNGIDIKKFAFSEEIRSIVRKKNEWEDKKVIGHVGRFSYQKNHEFLIQIFNEISKIEPNAILVMAGIGPLMDNIKKQVIDLGLEEKVQFLGNRSDINEIDQGFDLLLFPSQYEGLPVVLVEAQCTGLQCLISDIITSEIDVTKNIYRESLTKNPKEWAIKASMLMKNKKHREDMTNAITIAGYNIEDTAKILEDFYYR